MQVKLNKKQLFIIHQALSNYYWDSHKTNFDMYSGYDKCYISELAKYILAKYEEREIRKIKND